MKLNQRQRKFAELVLRGETQTNAYKKAGYKVKNNEVAKVCASQLLTKPNVAKYIADRQPQVNAKLEEETQVTKERLVREYARVAFANMSDFAQIVGGSVKFEDFKNLKPDQLAAVAEIGETVTKEGGSIRLKLHSKIDALTRLGEQLGIFQPRKVQISTEDGEPIPFCLIPAQRKK